MRENTLWFINDLKNNFVVVVIKNPVEYCKEFLLRVTTKNMLPTFQQDQGYRLNWHPELDGVLTSHTYNSRERK